MKRTLGMIHIYIIPIPKNMYCHVLKQRAFFFLRLLRGFENFILGEA